MGGVNTSFIDQQIETLNTINQGGAEARRALGAIAVARHRERNIKIEADALSPWRTARGWRINQAPSESIVLVDGDQYIAVIISRDEISISGQTKQFSVKFRNDNNLTAIIDGVELQGNIVIHNSAVTIFCNGESSRFQIFNVLENAEARAGDIGEEIPLAPMPGIVVSVLVEIGGDVAKGDALMVIEAMKVEHTIRAAVGGVVDAIYYQPGDSVDERAQLIAITHNET